MKKNAILFRYKDKAFLIFFKKSSYKKRFLDIQDKSISPIYEDTNVPNNRYVFTFFCEFKRVLWHVFVFFLKIATK